MFSCPVYVQAYLEIRGYAKRVALCHAKIVLMETALNPEKLGNFMEQIGRRATGPGRIYLVGGATALLLGIRGQTVDVDIKLDPEPPGTFEAIALLKQTWESTSSWPLRTTSCRPCQAGGKEASSSRRLVG